MVKANIRAQFLIGLVCGRPALWDKTCDDYKERELKEMSWREICNYVNKDYNGLPTKEKELFTKSIIKRWTHIRDSWFKSMKYGYDEATMMPPKPYVYHDEMQFMQKILKFKSVRCDPTITQLSKTSRLEEPQNCYGSSKEAADKRAEIKNETDADFSAVTLKQEPNANNNDESEFTIIECEERKLPTPVKSARVTTPERCRAQCHTTTTGHNLYENHNCNFFKGILPSVNGLDEDHILQFQSGVISLLRNLRNFQRVKSHRSRLHKVSHNAEDAFTHKYNSRLTRQSLDSEDEDSEMEYLTDD